MITLISEKSHDEHNYLWALFEVKTANNLAAVKKNVASVVKTGHNSLYNMMYGMEVYSSITASNINIVAFYRENHLYLFKGTPEEVQDQLSKINRVSSTSRNVLVKSTLNRLLIIQRVTNNYLDKYENTRHLGQPPRAMPDLIEWCVSVKKSLQAISGVFYIKEWKSVIDFLRREDLTQEILDAAYRLLEAHEVMTT